MMILRGNPAILSYRDSGSAGCRVRSRLTHCRKESALRSASCDVTPRPCTGEPGIVVLLGVALGKRRALHPQGRHLDTSR